MSLADRIKQCREDKGWTQPELAAKLGVGQTTVSMWETGERVPRDNSVLTMCELFNCSPDWLRYGKENKGGKRLARLRGYVGAGDVIHMLAQDSMDFVDAPASSDVELEAFQVRGTSQYPVYRDGDVVYFDPEDQRPPTEMIGTDCIVELTDGKMMLKRLEYGSVPGLFTLASYNAPEIRDQSVKAAAEVTWVKRSKH